MKAGDKVGGYTLLENFRVVGAGLSEWSFAERDGKTYFIKRFLSPTYPDDAAPGSAATKARKRARCAGFEAHHRGIQAALAPITSYGGNLIATLDFFREGAKYYKITEKVDLAGLEPTDVARMKFSAKLVLLKTVAHSLRILHDLGIVHSDLKPSNVLIKRTERGYTTKLIDFDSSYIVGNPPPPDEITGTMNYYSPELVRYIQGTADATELSQASDIFALGLIYTEYLTGTLPPFDPSYHEAAIAVLNGDRLRVAPAGLPESIVALVERMLMAEPAARPRVEEVHAALMGLPSPTPTTATPLRPPPSPSGSAPSILRGKGLRFASEIHRTDARTSPSARSGAVYGASDHVSTSSAVPPASTSGGATAVTVARAPAPDSRGTGFGNLVGKLLTKIQERRDR